jgi:hypothetical protein
MGNRVHSASTPTLTNSAESANNTETVVATLTGVTPEFPNQVVKLRGWLKCTMGTGTTAGLLRVRKQTLTGTSLGDGTAETILFIASKTSQGTIEVEDTPGEGTFSYVLTYQGTGDTSVTTFLATELSARWD